MACDPCAPRNISTATGGGSSTCQPGPRGARGPAGSGGAAGSDGLHAYTLVTAEVEVSDVGSSFLLEVGNGSWIGVGQIIHVEGAGYFSASAPTPTSVALTNIGYGSNAPSGTLIEIGAVVSPGGPKGANAPDDTRGYILLRRELPNNTDGGTFTSGAWRARLLNTTATDSRSQVLELDDTTGIFKIKAGKYKVRCEAPAFDVVRHRSRLRNITSGAVLYGTSEYTGDNGQTSSLVLGEVNLLVDSEFILESRCQITKATSGMGNAANFGVAEVFEFVEFVEVP